MTGKILQRKSDAAINSKIFIASDHAGFLLKQFLIEKNRDRQWEDLGVFKEQKSDYPDQAKKLCNNLLKEQSLSERVCLGLLVCGSGQGMAIQANRYLGIRAVAAWSEESACLAREHNQANVLCLGARLISFDKANDILKTFLQTQFKGGRHIERIRKLESF